MSRVFLLMVENDSKSVKVAPLAFTSESHALVHGATFLRNLLATHDEEVGESIVAEFERDLSTTFLTEIWTFNVRVQSCELLGDVRRKERGDACGLCQHARDLHCSKLIDSANGIERAATDENKCIVFYGADNACGCPGFVETELRVG